MVQLSRFTCPVCAYEANVAGGEGEDDGYPTRTMVCLECRELFDAAVPLLAFGSGAVVTSG